MPPDLGDTMEAVIARIQKLPSSKAKLGMEVLMWLHLAYRPLQLAELQHALSVEAGQTELDPDDIPSQKVILDSCLGLVILDEETRTIRFVHYTLEEYFRDHGDKHFPNGCRTAAVICLTYLNFGDLVPHCQTRDELWAKMEDFAFLKYAAVNWGYYVARQCDDTVSKLALKILERVDTTSCPLQVLYGLSPSTPWAYDLTDTYGNLVRVATKFSGVHVAAHFGLAVCLQCLCQTMDMNDDTGRTALSWAAEMGNESVVQLLLARDDVYINAKSNIGCTPLSFAAQNGHKDVVQLLLARDDIDINAHAPLYFAAKNGHKDVVQLLLARDAYVNIMNSDWGLTPLSLAAQNGHKDVVQLLLARDDVDINAKSFGGRTPLSWAAIKGHKDVVQLLLARDDVDVNTKDSEYGQTPLSFAAKNGHKGVVQLLLARDDVDVNTKDSRYGQTPLSWAAEKGHEDVVQLLLARDDVDVNTKDSLYGHTPLSWAAEKGHKDVVQLLLARDDVDVNTKDSRYGRTPLSWAAGKGHKDLVQFLLARDDVDVNIKCEDGRAAADYARERRCNDIADLLDSKTATASPV